MQVGSRWQVGTDAPRSLPEVVAIAVRSAEGDLVDEGVATGDWYWTLTYLECAPVVELDDGTTIRYNRSTDEATMTLPAESLDDPFDED